MRIRKVVVKVIVLLAAAGVLLAVACGDSKYIIDAPFEFDVIEGNGEVVEQSRNISGCTSVDLQGVGVLYIRQGAREELRIRAEENLLEFLRTDVQGGELRIWKEFVSLSPTHPIEYHLTVVDLERATLTGAGQIRASNLDTGPLALLLSGVGDVEFLNLNAPALDVDSSGTGDVILSGSVQSQTIELRAMGDYNGRDLDSAEAEVRIDNAGSATVRVSDRLTATIRGSGSVYYIGDPVVESEISGSGGVVQIGG